jgi:cell wall-associated NlpC family hydrolase
LLDPRLTLARNGIAARSLQGIVPADRYLDTSLHQTAVPAAALRREPSAAAEQLDQLLFGEAFEGLEESDGWAFGRAVRDGYVGFVEASALQNLPQTPTHTVRALRTYGFSEPSIKAAPTGLYSMNALLVETGREGRFVQTSGGWFVGEHLAAISEVETDPVAVAQRFVGTPYLWGGRESLGLDCSGLVQQALYACGRDCPRDTDQQVALGHPVETPRRGDLVFWRGHVAMMTTDEHMIHANAFHMAVVIEPLAQAVARISSRGGGEPTAYRRLD